jgi:hypothetical protein
MPSIGPVIEFLESALRSASVSANTGALQAILQTIATIWPGTPGAESR